MDLGSPEVLEEWWKNWCDLCNAKFAEAAAPGHEPCDRGYVAEGQDLTLEFDREHCFWQLNNVEKTIFPRKADPLLYSISGFIVDKSEWTGTATELVGLLDCADAPLHCEI